MSKNYRLLYENEHGKIEEGWHIHHIDWNRENNTIDNLISLPPKVHQLIHGYLGYTTREEIVKLTNLFLINKNYRRKTVSYLNHKLSEHVNLNKGCELSISCRGRLDNKIENYHNYLSKYKKKSKIDQQQDRVKEYREQMIAPPKEKERELSFEEKHPLPSRPTKLKAPNYIRFGKRRRLTKL